MHQEKPYLGEHQNRSGEGAQHSGPCLLQHEMGLQLRLTDMQGRLEATLVADGRTRGAHGMRAQTLEESIMAP